MYFGQKHVETGPNCSDELVTFLKYHMPLSTPFSLVEYPNLPFSLINLI